MTTHRAPLPARLHPATALPYRPTHRRFLWRRVIVRRLTGVLAVPALLLVGFATAPAALPAAPAPYVDGALTRGAGNGLGANPGEQTMPQSQFARVEHLVARHDCSTTGLPDGQIPVHALIVTVDGHVKTVPFAVGWAMHEGQRPGELHAVCAR